VHLASVDTGELLVDEGPLQWADDSILSVERGGREEEVVGADSIWGEGEGEGEEEDEDEEGVNATVVLAIPPAAELSPPPSPVRDSGDALPLRASSSASVSAPAPVAAPAPALVAAPPPPAAEPSKLAETKLKPSSKTQQVKVTPETEANTVRSFRI
jgi:hypothetical protein